MERKDRLIQEYIHDPYFSKAKLRDPLVCEKCKVVFRNGIFEWVEKIPSHAEKMVCPACRRTDDDFEGGIVLLEGEFLSDHKSDIMNIVGNVEKTEKKYRPLERIMKLNDYGNRVEITTTYEHIARRIGEAVQKAYKGDLSLRYGEGEKHIRVSWKR